MACQFTSVRAKNGEVSELFNSLSDLFGQEMGMKLYLESLRSKNDNLLLDSNSEPAMNESLWQALGIISSGEISLYRATNLVTNLDSNSSFGQKKFFSKSEMTTELIRVNRELATIDSSKRAIDTGNGTISIITEIKSNSPFTGTPPSRLIGTDIKNITALKNYQILQAKKRIAEIEIALKDETISTTIRSSIVRERTDLRDRIKNLKVDGTKITTTGTFSNFFGIANDDLDLIKSLVNSDRIADLEQAKILIDFYKKVGDFSSNGVFDHILFGESLVDTNGNVIVDILWQQPFIDLAVKAAEYDTKLEHKRKKLLTESVNNSVQVSSLIDKGQLATQSFTSIMKNAKDRDTFFSKFLSVDTDNTVLGQVLHSQLEKAHEKALLNFEKYRLIIDDLTPKINKLFKDNNWLGSWKVSPNFKSIFAQKDEFGNETGNLVTRYSTEWYSAKGQMDRFLNKMKFNMWSISDKTLKFKGSLALANRESKWLKDNTVQLNTLLVEDVFNHPDLAHHLPVIQQLQNIAGHTQASMDTHKQELIDLIGQHEYDRFVRQQVNHIKLYDTEYQNKLDDLADDVTIGKITQADADNKAQRYRLSNNPYLISFQFNNSVLTTNSGEHVIQNWQDKNIYIPQKINNYHDSNFDVISNNQELLEFYETMLDINRELISLLPPKQQDKFKENSLLFVDQAVTEIILDKTKSNSKTVDAKRNELVKIISSITQSEDYTGEVNPVTGERIRSVNASNLSLKEIEISKLVKEKRLAWYQANVGKSVTALFNNIQQTLIIGADSTKTIEYYLPDDVRKSTYSEARAEVMSNKSWDLPTVMKLFAFYSTQLESREESLPLLNLQKAYYNQIRKPVTTNLGTSMNSNTNVLAESLRDTANSNMTEWFDRVVLMSNENTKTELGKGTHVYTVEDKELLKKYQDIIKTELEQTNPDIRIIDEAQNQLNYLKNRVLTYDGMANMMIKYLQFKGMGWNVPSMFNNISVGVVANFVAAADNRNVKLEHMVKAYRMVLSSILKNLSFDKISIGQSTKIRILMDRYRILQDSTNEIQKASTNSVITHKLAWTAPLEGQRRGEYLNQAPLMIAKLMNTEITGIDGTVSTVWESLDNNGELLPNFKTDANIQAWERTDEKDDNGEYFKFKSSLDNLIVDTHGDYHELRGMSIKANTWGKLLMVFKTWLPRAFYARLGDEQLNIKLGYTKKGRYRSYTGASAAVGTIIGMSVFANPLTLGGGLAALALASITGVTVSKLGGRRTNVSLGSELTFTTKEFVKNFLLASSFGAINMKADDGNRLLNGTSFTDTDLANLKSNIMELAFVANYTMLLLVIKYLTYDDDDDKKSAKRKTHNLLVNQLAQLTGDLTQFASIAGLKQMASKAIPLLTTLADFEKVVERSILYANDKDIISSGENAGESGLANAASKAFVPSFITNKFGIDRKTTRQFVPTAYDEMFYSEEHIAKNQKKRENAKKNLEEKERKAEEEANNE